MLGSDFLLLASVQDLNMLALGILTGLSLLTWLGLAIAKRNSIRVSTAQKTPSEVPWGLVDVWIVVLIWFFSFSLTVLFVDPQSKDKMQANLANGAAMLVATVAGIGWMILRYGRAATAWIVPRRWIREIGIGCVVFLAFVPPIFWLMGYLVQFLPYHHETLDQIKASPTPGVIWSSFFAAALAASIGEEFFFRLVLQSWLQRLRPSGTRNDRQIWLYGNGGAREKDLPAGENSLLLQSSLGKPIHPIGPIAASALIFAMMHFGQGPAPIALFVLGLGLGYVFWVSKSWLACVVPHAAMNSYSLFWETLDALEKSRSVTGG